MDWYLLGIEPTKDKKAITAAYRNRLRQTNPEDKPEEFKALRSAYEEALALADQAEQPRDERPVGLWMEEVQRLYQHYPSRIDPAKWQNLMDQDVCVSIDGRAAAEELLLKFLMEHYFLPKEVWNVLDRTFRFSQRVEELYETWPREFIDHAVMAGIRLEPSLGYDLFEPGVNANDCDAYRNLYFQALKSPRNEAGDFLEQMDALSERHPYGESLRYHYWISIGRVEEAREGLKKLAYQYPEDLTMVLAWSQMCMENGDHEEAEALAKGLLEHHPDASGAKHILAQCLAQRGEYHEAKELAYDVLHITSANPVLLEQVSRQMKEWNLKYIEILEEKCRIDPDDADSTIELARCYAQNERIEDALELLRKSRPKEEDSYPYHSLISKLLFNLNDFSGALEHLVLVEGYLRHLTPDGTEETDKRLKRFPETLQMIGSCHAKLGDDAAAMKKYEEALEIAPDDPEVLLMMGKIHYSANEFEKAVEVLDRLTRINPGMWVGDLMLALACYGLKQDREAFDAVNRALAFEGGDLSLYVVKMQILLRNGIFEEVHSILEFLKESNAPEDLSIDYIRAQLLELEKQDTKNALRMYQDIASRLDAGETLIWNGEFYYRLAVLTGNQLNLSDETNREKVLALVDKGLSHHEQNGDLLAYKAWILNRAGLAEDAVAMYQEILERYPDSVVALSGLAKLYFEDLDRHAPEALQCYEKLLKTQKTPELYYYTAVCRRAMGDYEGAKADYLREVEMDPDDMDGYRGLAFLAEVKGEYDRSLELLDRALEILAETGREYHPLVEHKVKVLRRMGRYEDALAFVDAAVKLYRFDGALQLKFDICCQFGLWDQAKQILNEWKQINRNDPELMAATGRLNVLMNKPFKAAVAMGPAKHKLPFERIQDFRLQLADLENNLERKIQIWSRRAKEDPMNYHPLATLAQVYWFAGKQDAAKGAARKALELLDEVLTGSLTDEALYRAPRCVLLAILGREAEARAELAKTRALPLCDFCEYGGCKDSYIFEGAMEEILGNRDKALEIYRFGRSKWPDDLDFLAGEIRLNKRGKRKC